MAMMLTSALQKRLRNQRTLFAAQLSLVAEESALGLQAKLNFEAESRLTQHVWDEFIDAVIEAEPNAASIRQAIRKVMQKHILKGPYARCPFGAIIGRAVSLKRLARTFVAHGYFASPSAAYGHIRSMRPKSLDNFHKRWGNLYLGRFVMWGTFNKEGGRPLDHIKPDAQSIMGRLGLAKEDDIGVSNPILIMEYVLPASIRARIPRVVEAYSGEDWVYYFRPAPRAEKGHGLALPWAEFCLSSPRPEIVHEPVTGNYLVMPLWEAM